MGDIRELLGCQPASRPDLPEELRQGAAVLESRRSPLDAVEVGADAQRLGPSDPENVQRMLDCGVQIRVFTEEGRHKRQAHRATMP